MVLSCIISEKNYRRSRPNIAVASVLILGLVKGAGSYLAGMAVAIPILNVDGRCDNYRVSGALEKLEHETILQDRASDR